MVYSDKIVSVGDFFGIELFVLKTGKERMADYDRLRREKNKEKLKEQGKIYRKNNKEKIREQRKIIYYANIEKMAEKNKKYKTENKEILAEKRKIYEENSPKHKKTKKILDWKYKGLIHDDYSKLYDDYFKCTQCDVCEKEFKTRQDKCMDHDHLNGLFRHFLCQSCNNHDHWKKVLKSKETK